MAAADVAERWADEHHETLQKILDDPSHDHGVRGLLPPGGLRVAHVIGLVGELSTRRGGPWDRRYKGKLTGGRLTALHTWLYHLGGGADAKLAKPTCDSKFKGSIAHKIEEMVIRHRSQRTEANAARNKCLELSNSTTEVDALLAQLVVDTLQPFDWRLLRTGEAPGPSTGGGGGGGAQPTRAEQSVAARDLRWLIARGVATRGSPLYALGGHGDILYSICDMACIGGMARWAPLRTPRPQIETLRQLYYSHAEVVALREQISERDTLIAELQTEAARAAKREEHAVRLASEARAATERVRADEEERVQAIIKEAGRRERALKKEAAETEVEWQLYANRLKNDKADAMREMDRSRREELVELTRLRKEADARYAELNEALAHEFDASERLREMRGGSSWAKQRRVLEEEAAALKKRRTLNQRRISDANLADQRAKAATEARQRIEEHVTDAWRSEAIVSSVDYHALQAELTRTRLDLEAQKMETAKYKAIAEPPKEYFFKSGHFSAPVDLACLQTLQLGVTRSKAPALFLVFARLFRITLPSREKKVPGPWVDGKRTTQVRIKLYVPGTTHLKHVAGMMYELNKLQVGQWLVEYLESDETSCCYLADGAESDQVEKLGQALARRINGKLELKALDLNAISSKTGEAQAAAFTDSIEAVAELMERAGMVDARLKELLRRFIPTCSQNDRAANGRLAARRVVGLADGDDDPTCGIHALVNILEEGRKAMDSVLHELMNITAEQAEADASKVKAMRTCVGWFSSPACALIYQVAKYVALCSTKGYAIGKKYREWFEARLADLEEVLEELEETIERRRSDLLAGHAEDLQAICGGRLFVFWIDASVTERLLTPGPLSLLTYLDEEEELQAAGGGKLRKSILTGARSECMASLRAMSIVTDVVFWKMVKALQPSADKHVLDVLPTVWPNAHAFFTAAAASPASLYDKSLTLDVGVDIGTNIGAQTVATGTTASHAGRRSERARLDMERIYAKAKDDPLVERLLTAAFTAFAKATANHASEFLPAGLERTDGTIGGAGKLCKANITPELLARYDALVATSIPVERLHAIGRHVDDRCKKQRVDARAGISLAIFNDQGGWACATADADMSQLERQMDAAREEAAKARKMTMKAMRIGEGRAKRAERDRQLGGKRARKEKKKAERARLETVKLATHYSQLTAMPIIGEGSLQEQLKVQKLAGKTGFTVTQKDRAAYVTQLQALIFAAEGAKANDLDDGDSGCGAERVVRKRRAASESTGAAKSGKKREEMETLDLGDGRVWTWPKSEVFEIERILDTRMVTCKVGSAKSYKMRDYAQYLILWKGFPPECATWQWPVQRGVKGGVPRAAVDEYEAGIEAEAQLDAEEAAEDAEDDEDDEDDE